MLYIGIDLGTSAVKLLLMDETGKIRNIVSEEYPVSFPRPGWSEQNPDDWIRAVKKGIQNLVKPEERSLVAGIGAAGQMHGLVVLDKEDHIIRPAILWNDGRAQEETEYLNTEVTKETLRKNTGNIAFAGFTAPKLLWMKKHEPELFGRIAKIMLPKDYINYRLTGVFSTDYSDASGTLLLDVKHKCWSREMLEICGIKEKQMPALYESFAAIGTLLPETAGELGLPETVRVVAGAGDNAAAAIGTGAVGNGRCNISLGTSGTIFISGEDFAMDPASSLHSFCHADGEWSLMGCMLSAASCNKWWMEQIIGTGDYAGEQAEIREERLGRNHVFFLPYLMGERAPYNDPQAKGTFTGLTMDSSRADMTQAVLEGVAFGMRDSLETARNAGITVRTSMICGGGAKSSLWLKIMANVLGIELTIPETEQGPGYGGAILAAVACGEFSSVKDATGRLVRIKDRVLPDAHLAKAYDRKYRTYHSLYPALRDLFPDM